MTIIPDKKYKIATNFDVNLFSYRKWQKEFSGIVLYHNLDGYFSNGWELSEGRVVTVVKQVGKEKIPIEITPKTCTPEYLHTVNYQCHWEGATSTKGWSCWVTSYTVEYLWDICTGGGGGDGAYIRFYQDHINFSQIYNSTSTLSAPQKDKLEVAALNFKRKYPFYKKVWESLISSCTSLKFEINSDTKDNAPAQYDPLTSTIRFKNESAIVVENLQEEFLHVYQHLKYGTAFVSEIRNYELEVKVLQDIESIQSIQGGGFRGAMFFNAPNYASNYTHWISLLSDGLDFTDDIFNAFCEFWFYPDINTNRICDPNFSPKLLHEYFSDFFSDPNGVN